MMLLPNAMNLDHVFSNRLFILKVWLVKFKPCLPKQGLFFDKKKPLRFRRGLCDPAGARTQDPYIKSVLLYQLSYRVPFLKGCKYRIIFYEIKCFCNYLLNPNFNVDYSRSQVLCYPLNSFGFHSNYCSQLLLQYLIKAHHSQKEK
jgi:hypothetical protein